jgi:Ca2+-binding RTX toxin-like protein
VNVAGPTSFIHAYYGGNWNNGESATYDGYNITLSQLGSSSEDFHVAMRELLLEENYENTPLLPLTSSLRGPLADAPNYIISDDSVAGGSGVDQLFPARGDDTVVGNSGNDLIVGGSGNDSLSGGDGNDQIYGDYSNVPDYNFSELVFITVKETKEETQLYDQPLYNFALPATAETDIGQDSGETQNDLLDGGDGADTLVGGPGNDQLTGGPRGAGNTDILTGGDGADGFYLTYTSGTSGTGTDSFWSSFGEDYVSGVAGGAVYNAVGKLAEETAKDFFESAAGSILLGGLGTAVGGAASEGLSLLFGMGKSPEPQPTGEDVMVVTDFDPREDVLFLPLSTDDATTLVATPANFGASGDKSSASGQTGWGIEFAKSTSNTIYAEVFLDTDFLDTFNVTSNSDATKAFIDDIFDQSVVIDSNGVQETAKVYPFPTDPSAYTDGIVPTIAGGKINFQAPSGTSTQVYGAFGPQIIVGPAVTDNNTYVAGTNMGDIAFITTKGFAPEDWDNAAVVQQIAAASFINGYDGNDILNGSSGEDSISGGDGDDVIYGWNAAFAPLRDQLSGDAGNDTLSAAKPLGSENSRAAADFDGGDDTDTVTFAYSRESVTANLTTGIGSNAGDDTTAGAAYTFTDVENLTGTDLADSLTGDGNDNILQGNAGSDTLDGGDGTDTTSYADNTGKVTVDLPGGTAQEFGADGDSDANTVVSTDTLTSLENVVGSPFDDSITGDGNDNVLQGNAGDNTLYGGDGTDVVSFAGGSTALDIDMSTWSSTAPTTLNNSFGGTDTIEDFEGVIGGTGNDRIAGNGDDNILEGGAGSDTLTGRNGSDIASYAGNAGKVTVLLSESKTEEFGESGSANAETVVSTDTLATIEHASGSAFDDTISGDGNDNILQGNAGNDWVSGGAGQDTIGGGDDDDVLSGGNEADTINGDDGDDTISGDESSDSLNGNDGFNTLSYANNTGKVTVALYEDTVTGEPPDNVQEFGTNGSSNADTVVSQDRAFHFDAVLGSAFDDSITGNSSDNVLTGATGNDTIDGGGGDDTADYSDRSIGLTATLSAKHASGQFTVSLPGSETDTLTSIELVQGTSLDDTITGSSSDDGIGGDDGDDSLAGGGGGDTLDGGDGNDTLVGGDAGALYRVNTGGPELSVTDGGPIWAVDTNATPSFLRSTPNGGTNTDQTQAKLFYQPDKVNGAPAELFSDERWDAPGGQEMGWEFPVATSGLYQVNLYLFEGVPGYGPNSRLFSVSVEGSVPPVFQNINPYVQGGSGNGGQGNGAYVLSYQATITDGSVSLVFHHMTENPAIDAIEIIGVSSEPSADGADSVTGGAGNDVLIGRDDNDTLQGGDGDDFLNGGAGSDSLDGGDGTDTASYTDNTGMVNVNLPGGTTQEFGANGTADAGTVVSTDTIANTETVIGSAFDDTIVGNGTDNSLTGQAGDDTLQGNAGNNTLDGGDGIDVVSFGGATTPLVVDMSTWSSTGTTTLDNPFGGTDTIVDFEGVIGTTGDDTLSGDSNPNVLKGNPGNDTVAGGVGEDTIDGGDGDDVLSGGDEADTINGDDGDDTISGDASSDSLHGNDGFNTLSYANNAGKVTVALYEDTATGGPDNVQEYGANGSSSANTVVSQDRAEQFDGVLGSAYDDAIIGNSSDNVLQGNAGNDTLTGSVGNDTVTGGAGDDVFVLAAGDGTDTITDFVIGVDLIGLAGGLSFDDLSFSGSNILTGSETLATLTGINATTLTENDFVTLDPDVAPNQITDGGGGTSGDDYIFGSDEADTLSGGSGNDTLNGNGGEDDIDGGSDDDVLRGDRGDDTIRAGSGDDTATGGDGNDNVNGGSGDDELAGAGGDDTVLGTADDDDLAGGSGDDVLVGGSGDDRLTGGPGDDTLTGGSGDDTFVLAAGDGPDTITDFEQGGDAIGLGKGLAFENLTFSGSTIAADDEILATLTGIDATTLTELDFVTL